MLSHQQNGKIVSGFRRFCRFFWFPETWKGNFLEKSQHFVRYRSGLGLAGLNDARPCRQVSTKRDIGSQVLMFPGFLMVFDGFLEFPRLRNPWKLKCPNTDAVTPLHSHEYISKDLHASCACVKISFIDDYDLSRLQNSTRNDA